MSQHHFETMHAGTPVDVLLGWDRPLGHFFLVVEKKDAPRCDDDDYLYSNLLDDDSSDHDLEYYLEKLKELQIEVPLAMFEQVSYDAMFNVGNRHVTYTADGRFIEQADCCGA